MHVVVAARKVSREKKPTPPNNVGTRDVLRIANHDEMSLLLSPGEIEPIAAVGT